MDADAFQAVSAPRSGSFPASLQPPLGVFDHGELDGRLLSRLRRLAGLCRSSRDRAQTLSCAAGAAVRVGKFSVCTCPYCGMTDHEELVSLVAEKSGSNAAIDACKRCLGYVKTFTTLQGSPAANVMVDDLGQRRSRYRGSGARLQTSRGGRVFTRHQNCT